MASPTDQQQPAGDPPSLWRNRDYLSWWTGTAFSVLGTNGSLVAFRSLAVLRTPLAEIREIFPE